jgi:hypothetical protein
MVLCLVFLVLVGDSVWCFIHLVLIGQYSCVVVSLFGSGRKLVLILHTYVLRVQYNCCVVLVFWSWREIVIDFTYVFSVQYSCGVVPVFLVVAGNSSQNENTFLQKIYWVTLL